MKSNLKKVLYISGPPCAGKSTVSNKLIKRTVHIHHILGDEFWLRNENYDFEVRIKRTNDDILSELETITSSKILVEWVPSFGPFIESIRSISESNGYEFIHIILTAPKAVLENRKLMRDGNMDLGPVDLEKYKTLKNVTLFDTSVESMDSIVNKCMSLLV